VQPVSSLALASCALAACIGAIGGPGDGPGANGAGPSGSSSSPLGGGAVVGPDGGIIASLLPVRIRRLSNAEFDASTHVLLGTQQTFASQLPADIRQGSYLAGGLPVAGFARNSGAVFDAVSAPKLQSAADSLASEAVSNHLSTLAPCSDPNQTNCATTFINTFGAKAFRRPVTSDELSGLLTVYQAGVKDQTYAAGIQLVITTILQSAGFLYLTELGGTVANGTTKLTSYEVAANLSYFITGGPPDATLAQAAAADMLQDPTAIGAQATRLLKSPGGQSQMAAFVEQWLGMDTPPGTSTGTMVTSAAMTNETTAFISDVMLNGDGTLATLLTAQYTFVDSTLAQLYGLPAPGSGMTKVQNSQRTGLLNQASFLNSYAHTSFSAPVKRGHMVRTQMLCDTIPPPDPSLKVNTSPPLPTGAQTTRQADNAHMTVAACASCHTLMDPIGFGFENFDGNGAYRTTESGLPIDPSGELTSAGALTGNFASGAELIQKLATSDDVTQCYWKKFADFAAAETDPGIEATFMNFWQQQPQATQKSLPLLIAAFVQSDLFLKRSAQ
jgi:hypothetical protein